MLNKESVRVSDAFNMHLSYYLRIPALRLFYKMVEKDQKKALKKIDEKKTYIRLKVKPQISPFYTHYPNSLAIYASMGLTAFLEYKVQSSEKVLAFFLKDYFLDPGSYDDLYVDKQSYQFLVKEVANAVEARLILKELEDISSLEFYRLYAASQQSLKYKTVSEIINSIILYGDLLPDWEMLELDPMTRDMLHNVYNHSLSYFKELEKARPEDFIELGINWVRYVSRNFAKFLPLPEDDITKKYKKKTPNEYQKGTRLSNKEPRNSFPNKIPPLNQPQPPVLFAKSSTMEQTADNVNLQIKEKNITNKNNTDEKEIQKTLQNCIKALNNACGCHSREENIRSDIVEEISRLSPFKKTSLEGNPIQGNEVILKLDDHRIFKGEIFDRPMVLSDDYKEISSMKNETEPIVNEIKKILYPNIERVHQTERFHFSGLIDPGRLSLINFSQAVFKRYRIHKKMTKKGSPLLVIASDGSGSVNRTQMKMLKLLAISWISSIKRTNIKLLAGLYHSGNILRQLNCPLVQWIYHPHKTPAFSNEEAIRAVLSLPQQGTGVQSDALSIRFILDEAKQLAQGEMVYFILITDCVWNRSFPDSESGEKEVQNVFNKLDDEFNHKIHTTLINLNNSNTGKIKNCFNNMIFLSSEDSSNSNAVAKKISCYVASCIKERKYTKKMRL